eukprot:g81556.t1
MAVRSVRDEDELSGRVFTYPSQAAFHAALAIADDYYAYYDHDAASLDQCESRRMRVEHGCDRGGDRRVGCVLRSRASGAEWTKKAMGGDVPFEKALSARLEIIAPSQQQIDACLRRHPLTLTPGVEELIRLLQTRGTHVYLVSGGFRQMIHPLARKLNISLDHVYANQLLLDKDGNFLGHNHSEPTCRAGGKARVLQTLKQRQGYRPLVMVGTVLQTWKHDPLPTSFGFGGIAVREVVRKGADWFVYDMKDLIYPLQQTQSGSLPRRATGG